MMRRLHHLVGLVFLLAGGIAVAGHTNDQTVVVNLSSRFASASMAAARSSLDSVQFLQCGIIGTLSGVQGQCSARNSSGFSFTCNTTSPYLIDAIRSIADTSYVYFAWDTTGACTAVHVYNGSTYGAKQP